MFGSVLTGRREHSHCPRPRNSSPKTRDSWEDVPSKWPSPAFSRCSLPQGSPVKHHQASSSIVKHHQASSSIINRHVSSSTITRHHQASWIIINYRQALSSIITHHHSSSFIITHHHSSSLIITYHHVSSNTINHHQPSSTTINHHQPSSTTNGADDQNLALHRQTVYQCNPLWGQSKRDREKAQMLLIPSNMYYH